MDICPYLGKYDDQQTPILYPSEYNVCYRGADLRMPELPYQESCCLRHQYAHCPAYVDSARIKEVPTHRPQKSRKKERGLVLVLAAILICLISGAAVWLLMQKPNLLILLRAPSTTPSATVSLEVNTTPTAIVVAAIATPSPTAPLLPTHTPVNTPQPTHLPGGALETPIGTDVKFVIHRLVAGDNYSNLTNIYATSVEAIQQVNYALLIPLRAGDLVIIPVGVDAIDPKTPVFEPYQVTAENITVDALGKQLAVNMEQLLFYNSLKAGDILATGTWVIVPHPRK
jgi:hypothetical protein